MVHETTITVEHITIDYEINLQLHTKKVKCQPHNILIMMLIKTMTRLVLQNILQNKHLSWTYNITSKMINVYTILSYEKNKIQKTFSPNEMLPDL